MLFYFFPRHLAHSRRRTVMWHSVERLAVLVLLEKEDSAILLLWDPTDPGVPITGSMPWDKYAVPNSQVKFDFGVVQLDDKHVLLYGTKGCTVWLVDEQAVRHPCLTL